MVQGLGEATGWGQRELTPRAGWEGLSLACARACFHAPDGAGVTSGLPAWRVSRGPLCRHQPPAGSSWSTRPGSHPEASRQSPSPTDPLCPCPLGLAGRGRPWRVQSTAASCSNCRCWAPGAVRPPAGPPFPEVPAEGPSGSFRLSPLRAAATSMCAEAALRGSWVTSHLLRANDPASVGCWRDAPQWAGGVWSPVEDANHFHVVLFFCRL